MKIKSLTVQGFRSFTAQQEINFAALRPGLYHLAGKNEVEPALEGNGAGKSSLLEAICWGLYGRTSRNLKAGAVKAWGSKEPCAVILEVATAAGDVGIFRVWNPKGNTLEVSENGGDPRPTEQKALEALLGVPPEAFLFSIYFSQFAPAFIDMAPSEQMAAYSTVLGLDLWERAAEAASKQAKELEGAVARSREAVASLEGQVAELEAQSFDEPERAWLERMADEEECLTKAQAEAAAAIKAAEKERAKYAAGSKRYREAKAKADEAFRAAATFGANARHLASEIEKLKKKDIKNCPTCGALVSAEHIKKEIEKQEALWVKADAAWKEKDQEHQRAVAALSQLEGEEKSLRGVEKELAVLGADHQSVTLSLERLGNNVNPFDAQRQDRDRKLASRRTALEQQKTKLGQDEAAQGSAAFWTKGFKELRLSLVEDSLAQLSVEANAALVGLGLQNWSLDFDVERETKKGTVSKGFTVLVNAPHVREPVPFQAWSGGESQRLRVASSLGFGELICSRMGLQPNVELWDEPSTWLSEAGIHDLLTALADRAERKGKVILLADHRALDFGGFAGTVNVVKTREGSKVTVC